MNIKTLLIEAEYHLDMTNSRYADKEKYCLYCHSTEYTGKVGIVHDKNCVINKLRKEIKK